MASSNGQVFFDSLARPDGEGQNQASINMAIQVGGSFLLMIYDSTVRPSAEVGTYNISIPETVAATTARIEESDTPVTHVVLNFESGFTPAIGRLGQGNDTQEDLEARQNMVDFMVAVKAANPGVKFSYYQIPGHRADFIAGTTVYDVVTNPDSDFTAGGDTFTGAEWMQNRFEERWNANQPIIEVSDFLAPSTYDKYPSGVFGSTTRGNPENAGVSDQVLLSRQQDNPGWGLNEYVAVRKDLVMGMCRYMKQQMGRPFMPTIPFINHFYAPKGNERDPLDFFMPLFIGFDDYIEKQVRPYLDGGANSIIQWGADHYFGGLPFLPGYPVDDSASFAFSWGVDPWREALVLEFPEVFNITGEVDRINDWRNVDWYTNGSPDTQLRDDVRIAMRDRRLEYIRRASRFVKLYGAARASTLSSLGGPTPSTP